MSGMRPKLVITTLLTVCLMPLVYGQTVEDLEEKVKRFHECFFNTVSRPDPHEETYKLSSGKEVTMLAQSDFARSTFVSVDNTLREVISWKESPFMWQIMHQKTSKAIMDGLDLTDWEINSFEDIADNYFKDSPSTFHIAAHGLIDSANTPLNQIRIGGVDLNAYETAELMLLSMQEQFHAVINAEHQKFVVVVHCCSSAVGDRNFSQELSSILSEYMDNVTVVGAPDTVFCKYDENGNYQEFITSNKEIKKSNPSLQNWRTYKNGKETHQGQRDYSATIKSIQSK